MIVESGDADGLGARLDEDGANFAVVSPAADRIELCLFDERDRESRCDLLSAPGGVWHGYLPGIREGQRYGFRAHGRYQPEAGLRFNPSKLLIDPYARALDGTLQWSPAVFDYVSDESDDERDEFVAETTDSAAYVPRSIVTGDTGSPRPLAGRRPWSELIVYEANVRGYTMRHPELPASERGRFRGLANGRIIDYLKAIGVTSIELQPVFDFVDEQFLAVRGLRNFWGYNPIAFFAPAGRYASADACGEFREMVDALHEAGLEVLLDVVYNHTAEGGPGGPTLSFRGLDDVAYYRRVPGKPLDYVNDTGTGNTLDADSPVVQRLVIDSLHYWARVMQVDGFRFDLAPILGRSADGFRSDHPLLTAIATDPLLAERRLIAEPWDPGPGGYQLGHFPAPFAEWNDRYRDSVRRFWRGDRGEAAEFASRLQGSPALFATRPQGVAASVNLVTAHDGFTLADLVSYEHRHNEANLEDNRDGHAHNFSANYGIEGETLDPDILAVRRRQRLNLLATLLLSEGTPMLLAGDELGNSQQGNNNAYAQDNEIGWIDWSGLETDAQFFAAVHSLIELRARYRAIGGEARKMTGAEQRSTWLKPNGRPMQDDDWADAPCLQWQRHLGSEDAATTVLMVLNAADRARRVKLPDTDAEWRLAFASVAEDFRPMSGRRWQMPPYSLAVFDSVAA